MENTLQEIQAEVIEDFSVYDEWLDKYEYLIELGRSLPAYPEEKRDEAHLIKGCQSRVWIDWTLRDGRLWFSADSDAIITKGIVNLLIRVLSGHTPQEILDNDLAYIDADKREYIDYYEAVLPKLRPGGIIIADDVLLGGKPYDENCSDAKTEALRAFNEHVKNDPRVEVVILPLRDGISIIRKF